MVKELLKIATQSKTSRRDLKKLVGKVTHSVRSFDTEAYNIISGERSESKKIHLLPRECSRDKRKTWNFVEKFKEVKLKAPKDQPETDCDKSDEAADSKKSFVKNQDFPHRPSTDDIGNSFKKLKTLPKLMEAANTNENKNEVDKKHCQSEHGFRKKEHKRPTHEVLNRNNASRNSTIRSESRTYGKSLETSMSRDPSYSGCVPSEDVVEYYEYESPSSYYKYDTSPSRHRRRHSDYRRYRQSNTTSRRRRSSRPSYRPYCCRSYGRRDYSCHSDEEHFRQYYPCPAFDRSKSSFKSLHTLERLLAMDPAELRLLSQLINPSSVSTEKPKVEVVKMIECEKPQCPPVAQLFTPMSSTTCCTTAAPPTIMPAYFQPQPMPCQPSPNLFCTEISNQMPQPFLTNFPVPSPFACTNPYCANCRCCNCSQNSLYRVM